MEPTFALLRKALSLVFGAMTYLEAKTTLTFGFADCKPT